MPNALDKEDQLHRNLLDAGCDGPLTEECLRCFREGRPEEMLPGLTAHRKTVLAGLRIRQKQIDCLDYLTEKIRSKKY